jgi:hypothetical protein
MPASSHTAQVFPILHARIKSPTWCCQNLPRIRVVYTVPNPADASVLRPVSGSFTESVTHQRRLTADRAVFPSLLFCLWDRTRHRRRRRQNETESAVRLAKIPPPAQRPQYQSPAGGQPCVQPGLAACVPVVDDAPWVRTCRRPTGEGVTYEPLDRPSRAASARLPQLCPPVRGNDEGILKEVVGRTAAHRRPTRYGSINAHRGRKGAPWSLRDSAPLRGAHVGNVAGFVGKLASKFNSERCAPWCALQKIKVTSAAVRHERTPCTNLRSVHLPISLADTNL